MTTQQAALRSVTHTLRAALAGVPGLPAESLLLVAVSGGPDSLCLLHALATVAPTLHLRMHAAHLDHGLRGEEAAADPAFVRNTCERLGVPVSIERRSVPDYLASHPAVTSVEAAARAVRYQFFADVADAVGASAVVTGHTHDDQAETVLLHLLRGAGLAGLAAMAPDSTLPMEDGELRVLRPLLAVPRTSTLAYCLAAGLAPRQDASNASDAFTRNRIRRNLMPVLRSYNPAITEALTRLADQAQTDAAYWRDETSRALAATSRQWGQGLTLDRPALRAMPAALGQRVLRAAVLLVAPGTELTYDQTVALHRLLHGASGREITLEGGAVVLSTHRHLLVLASPIDLGTPPPATQLNIPGQLDWGGWHITATLHPPDGGVATSHWSARLDATAAGRTVTVRNRADGDRLHPLGMPSSKKLQDLLVDAHIPAFLRDHLPVFESQDGALAWVAGLRVAEAAKVVPVSTAILTIEVVPESPRLVDLFALL